MMGDTFYDSLDGGGLFSDAAELPVVGGGVGGVPAATSAVPIVEVRSSRPPRPPKPAAVGAPKPQAAAAAAAEVSAAAGQPPAPAQVAAAPWATGVAAAAEAFPIEESPFAVLAEQPSPTESTAAAAVKPRTAKPPAALTSKASGGGSRGQDGGSMLKTLGHSIRGMLPKPLRKYMDGACVPLCLEWGAVLPGALPPPCTLSSLLLPLCPPCRRFGQHSGGF